MKDGNGQVYTTNQQYINHYRQKGILDCTTEMELHWKAGTTSNEDNPRYHSNLCHCQYAPVLKEKSNGENDKGYTYEKSHHHQSTQQSILQRIYTCYVVEFNTVSLRTKMKQSM